MRKSEGISKVGTLQPFPAWPHFDADEVDAASAVLRSGRVNYWTGTEGVAFEREFADFHQMPYAIAVANGTLALELGLHALGIGVGDDVIVPARTFIASASCVVMRGARPIVADVDHESGNVTASTVEQALTPQTRAIVAVHLGGWPCDMDALLRLARARGIYVIEDCAQAHGATYKGRPIGSLGDVAAFSFCQDKIMTTGGEGGMLLLRDEVLWRRAWSFKDHGKDYDAAHMNQPSSAFRWLHESFGTNMRLTEMQAAIGRVQLTKLPTWHARRTENSAVLAQGFAGIGGLRTPQPQPTCSHAWYKFYTYLRQDKLAPGWSQSRIVEAIRDQGVPCFVGSCSEIYRERAFVDASMAPCSLLPIAHELGRTSLMFLVHPTLTRHHMETTVEVVRRVLDRATRV